MKKSLLKIMSSYCYVTADEAHKLVEWYLSRAIYKGDVQTNLSQMAKRGIIERKKNAHNLYIYKLLTTP
jgi:hypothetical protein